MSFDAVSAETPHQLNRFGQPVGIDVADWVPRPRPPRTSMEGRWCRIEPLDAGLHADQVQAANAVDEEGRMWTYVVSARFA
jgi:hypothetical protein